MVRGAEAGIGTQCKDSGEKGRDDEGVEGSGKGEEGMESTFVAIRLGRITFGSTRTKDRPSREWHTIDQGGLMLPRLCGCGWSKCLSVRRIANMGALPPPPPPHTHPHPPTRPLGGEGSVMSSALTAGPSLGRSRAHRWAIGRAVAALLQGQWRGPSQGRPNALPTSFQKFATVAGWLLGGCCCWGWDVGVFPLTTLTLKGPLH
jgi:hypothetical protein